MTPVFSQAEEMKKFRAQQVWTSIIHVLSQARQDRRRVEVAGCVRVRVRTGRRTIRGRFLGLNRVEWWELEQAVLPQRFKAARNQGVYTQLCSHVGRRSQCLLPIYLMSIYLTKIVFQSTNRYFILIIVSLQVKGHDDISCFFYVLFLFVLNGIWRLRAFRTCFLLFPSCLMFFFFLCYLIVESLNIFHTNCSQSIVSLINLLGSSFSENVFR